MTTSKNIPVSAPDLTAKEEEYVLQAIRSSWISSVGPFIDRFEREFAAACNTRASISVANGTVALHLALCALGVGPGDEVIVPSLTYVATANAVRYANATPVFADVTPQTWCIDPTSVASLITPRTKGIIAVHLYGHPADMDALSAVASDHNLWVVEDAAEAHFARYKGRVVGGLSSIGMFSFYGNKILTSGEGGALTVSDSDVEARARLLRGQGMDPRRRYFFPVIGYNYRLTNVAAALLCAQLERAEELVSRRRLVVERYREGLTDIRGIGLQPVASWATPAPWLCSITVDEDFGRSRDELMSGLAAVGIDTRPFFFPIHQLPAYRDSPHTALPETERLAARGINLPTYPALSNDEVDRVCSAIAKLRA